MSLLVLANGREAWPDGKGIHLVVTDAMGYQSGVMRTLKALLEKAPHGVIVTSNRPVDVWRQQLAAEGIDEDGLYFVDCVTGMTGILPLAEANAMYIESPSMLEKIALRAERVLRTMDGPKFILVDSLSTMAVYNGRETVMELAHSLTTRLRIQPVAAALLMVKQESSAGFQETLEALTDGVLHA